MHYYYYQITTSTLVLAVTCYLLLPTIYYVMITIVTAFAFVDSVCLCQNRAGQGMGILFFCPLAFRKADLQAVHLY
jgi:hypothetical protein